MGSPLPLYWWRRARRENFGDALSPIVVKALSGRRVQLSSTSPRLIAIGSVLHLAHDGDVVWGAGFKYPDSECGRRIDVRAVRGPLTRARLEALGIPCPSVYGDPALLLPRIIRPSSGVRKGVGVIPHYRDYLAVRRAIRDRGVRIIDLLGDPRRVVDMICRCEAIVSTSLHGIIVAEAYGVPAAWAIAGDRVQGGEFKFRDYYLATGRQGEPVNWRRTIDVRAALRALCTVGLARYEHTALLKAFPFPRGNPMGEAVTT